MNNSLEKMIVKLFITKERQDRLFYELTNNKRGNALNKFAKYLKPKVIIDKENSLPSNFDVYTRLMKFNLKDQCYIICWGYELDGKMIDLNSAIEQLNCNGFPALIVSIPSGFTYFKNESYASFQPNCLFKAIESNKFA